MDREDLGSRVSALEARIQQLESGSRRRQAGRFVLGMLVGMAALALLGGVQSQEAAAEVSLAALRRPLPPHVPSKKPVMEVDEVNRRVNFYDETGILLMVMDVGQYGPMIQMMGKHRYEFLRLGTSGAGGTLELYGDTSSLTLSGGDRDASVRVDNGTLVIRGKEASLQASPQALMLRHGRGESFLGTSEDGTSFELAFPDGRTGARLSTFEQKSRFELYDGSGKLRKKLP